MHDFESYLNNNNYRNISAKAINLFLKNKNSDKKSIVDFAIWRAWSKFNKNHSSKAKFETYLWTITRNLCFKENRLIASESELIDNISYEKDNLSLMFDDLNNTTKNLIMDRFYLGLTLKELSQKYKISLESVRRRIKSGLKLMS